MYLKFPFDINIEVKSELNSRIASIRTCILNENASNNLSINLLKVSNCSASITKFSDGKYNHIFVSECKTFSNVRNSKEFGKCFTYFSIKSILKILELYFIDNRNDVIKSNIKYFTQN
jgi:hypothetical protein